MAIKAVQQGYYIHLIQQSKQVWHPIWDFVHDNVIKWKHFPRYWQFLQEIHLSPVNSQHKGQWRGALMFSFICAWIDGWVNNGEAGGLRRHRAHCDVTLMHHLTSDVWNSSQGTVTSVSAYWIKFE